MKYNLLKYILQILILLFIVEYIQATDNDNQINLTENLWVIRLDTVSEWENDILYTPPYNINEIKENIPTGGWEHFIQSPGKKITIPATVEQYFWNRNNNPYGICGNYTGVSWFSTTVNIPKNFKQKRIILFIESVRLRAEVFVNHKLVGYDMINGTPFSMDISNVIIPGKENNVDIRITDPNGNFNWKDSQIFKWGNYPIIPSHGFGGITGNVKIYTTNKSYIDNVFIKNKPNINEIDIEVTSINENKVDVNGQIHIEIKEHKKDEILYSKDYPVQLSSSDTLISFYNVKLSDAKPWSVESPNLYDLYVTLKSNKESDVFYGRFGFRWFEVKDIDGDKQFYLNGKRIVLISAISWGFWPFNGITPSDSIAKKQILTAKQMGLNMLNFHRQIGHTNVLDYADELGLLYFEEPGGNKFPGKLYNTNDPDLKHKTDFYFTVRNERLSRMIKRDRNHPSLIIYNLHNERVEYPQYEDSSQMNMAHNIDETRYILYNSSNRNTTLDEPNERFKLHMRPYDHSFYNTGWWDCHHAGGPGVHHDNLYKDPDNYHRQATHSNEIIFWGEEGAIGTPPRLQLIRNEILDKDDIQGWQSHDYLQWYDVYDRFLSENNFRNAFADVEELTRNIGNNSLYYQGRVIENIRINNIVDGYVINGWESIKLENHSGVVDNYRNPKGDIEMIARYNKPLYVAVKIRNKVLPVGDTSVIDFFIVNEVNLNGNYTLEVNATDQNNEIINVNTFPVKITGGNTYGQLLKENVKIAINNEGYTVISAEIKEDNITRATGSDEIFAVKFNPPDKTEPGMIADTSGILSTFLKKARIDSLLEYDPRHPAGKWLLVGAINPPDQRGAGKSDLLEWVYKGNTLIIIDNVDKWADFLANKEVLDYRGSQTLGKSWFGGNYFVKNNPYFKDLPVNCAFNWEYQCLATYNKKRIGMRIFNGETIVGCIADHKKEVYSALSVIPAGRGKIIICSLDIFSCIQDLKVTEKEIEIDVDGLNASVNTYNTSLRNKSNIVGQQLLLNLITNCQ